LIYFVSENMFILHCQM